MSEKIPPPSIHRVRGSAIGRNAATAWNGLVWAVATDESDSDGIAAQTEKTLAALDAALKKAGADKSRLLSVTVYVADITLKEEMDAVWRQWIGDDPDLWPQRACIQTGLHGKTLVEIVALAAQT